MNLVLTPQQQTALVAMEVQQQALVFCAQMLAHPNVGQVEAAKAIEKALKAYDDAKMEWLRWTQHAVQVVAAIPDKLKLATG